jgi:hypothetical protein
MCPVCIASTAAMVAGAGSAGGILAVCIGKFRKLFSARRKEEPTNSVRNSIITSRI